MDRLPKTAIGIHAFNIGLVAMILQFALPSGLAMFPQEAVVNKALLESYFHNLKNSRGEVIENFAFNRGL